MQGVYQGVGRVKDLCWDESPVNLSGNPQGSNVLQSYLSRSRAFAASQVDWKYQRAVESELLRKLRVCYAWM